MSGSSSSSVWAPQVVNAVQLIGFAGQADYTNWAMTVATAGDLNSVSILLEAILDQ